MQKDQICNVLVKVDLFKGIAKEELPRLLEFLSSRCQCFEQGEMIFLAGYEESEIGVVLAGEIEAERTTLGGESLPITRIGAGGVFGDVLAGSRTLSPVTVSAATDCDVLFFSHSALLSQSGRAPAATGILLRNLVAGISDKYFALSRRVDLLITKSLRERVLLFLTQSGPKGVPLTLTMDKTRLAAYLGCDRSALCRELSRMQKDNILSVQKNTYTLL